jgi:3-dehydroquinate dehydratase I
LLPINRKICVSIPVLDNQNNDTNELELPLSQIEKAIQKGAELIECRFDFIKNYGEIDRYLKLLSKYKDQSVYTLRPQNEGGKFGNDHVQRIDLLQKLIDAKPLFVDVEYELVSKNDELADIIENSDARILVSWHDLVKTPTENELINLVNKMRVYSPYIKIVTTANTIDDSITVLKLYGSIDTHVNLIAFAMGNLGAISRILCSVTGKAPFTYASLGATIAPGQLSIDQMIIFQKLFETKII